MNKEVRGISEQMDTPNAAQPLVKMFEDGWRPSNRGIVIQTGRNGYDILSKALTVTAAEPPVAPPLTKIL